MADQQHDDDDDDTSIATNFTKTWAPRYGQIPQSDPSAFLFTATSVKVGDNAPWQLLLRRVDKLKAVYNNLFDDEQTRTAVFSGLAYQNILTMPVASTPFTIAMASFANQVVPLYTTSFQALYQLAIARVFMKDVCYSQRTEPEKHLAANTLNDHLERDMTDARITLKHALREEVYLPRKNGDINDTNATYKFVKILEEYTLFFINRMEIFIYDALLLSLDGDELASVPPRQYFLTANSVKALPSGGDILSLDTDGRQWAKMVQVLQHVLISRGSMWNALTRRAKEEQGDNTHVDVKLFDCERLIERVRAALLAELRDPMHPQLYKGWLLFDIALQYCNFLDLDYVTEEQLKGVSKA